MKSDPPIDRSRILIVGAGIGGLTLATLLARSGFDVTILEQAQTIEPVGAGIQLGPNALHVMNALMLMPALGQTAFEPANALLRDFKTGQPLLSTPLNPSSAQRYGQPYWNLHRADLMTVLLQAAEQQGARLCLNAQVNAIRHSDEGVTAVTQDQHFSADLVVGADGIRSVLRSEVIDDEAVFTGQTAWRALVPAAALTRAISPDANVWVGPGRHVVAYYVRGGELVNLVAVCERDEWVDQHWQLPGEVSQLQRAFAGWDPVVTELLASVSECFYWGLFDRPVPRKWYRGRVALLGDACHPMLPFMAQGAAMAIEDAWVLAQELEQRANATELALQRFQNARRPRVIRVHRQSCRNAQTYHRSNVAATFLRNSAFRLANHVPALTQSILDPLYGTNVTESGH